MEISQINNELKSKKMGKVKFVFYNSIDGEYFILVTNDVERKEAYYSLCFILKELIVDDDFPMWELQKITTCWEKNPNFQINMARSMYHQALRYPSNIVLINSNLVAVKKNNQVEMFWFKGNNLDASFRILNTYDISELTSQFFDLKTVLYDRNALFEQIIDLINQYQINPEFTKRILSRIYNRDTLLNVNFSILNQSYKETDILNAERLLYDEKYYDNEKKNVVREQIILLKQPIV